MLTMKKSLLKKNWPLNSSLIAQVGFEPTIPWIQIRCDSQTTPLRNVGKDIYVPINERYYMKNKMKHRKIAEGGFEPPIFRAWTWRDRPSFSILQTGISRFGLKMTGSKPVVLPITPYPYEYFNFKADLHPTIINKIVYSATQLMSLSFGELPLTSYQSLKDQNLWHDQYMQRQPTIQI